MKQIPAIKYQCEMCEKIYDSEIECKVCEEMCNKRRSCNHIWQYNVHPHIASDSLRHHGSVTIYRTCTLCRKEEFKVFENLQTIFLKG